MKQWVHTQKRDQTKLGGSVKSYSWKWFGCEICKEVYPSTFKVGNNIHRILDLKDDISASTEHYLVLESVPLEGKKTHKNIHLLQVSPEYNEFILGRGHNS